MRQRKLTALMLSAAMSISAFAAFTVTASAEAEAVNVFTANNAETYEAIMNDITAYDSTAAPIKEIQSYSWGIQAKFDNNGYNSNTGIKINVSDAIKGKKGTFAINADFTCYYWGDNLADGDEVASWNQAKLFLETADGTQTAIAQGPSAKNGNDAALSGSIEYDATADTTYYLCITQPSGQHQYKNISITYTAAETDEPGDGGNEGDSSTIFAPNSTDAYAALAVTPYDSTDAPFNGDLTFNDWGIEAKYNNNGYNGNTGVKIDITDAIKGKKGTFAISADFTCFYWGNNLEDGDEVDSWNQVKLFLETADGTQTAIAQGPDTKNGNDAALNGEIEYDATVETTYYLCFKQPSGQHQYKNISITYTAPETVTPAETEVEITGGYFWANDSYPAPEGYVVENGALKKEGTDEQVHVKQGYIENATFNKINVTVTWHPGEADEKSEMKTLDVGGTITGPAVFYVLLGMDGYQSHTVTATAVAE